MNNHRLPLVNMFVLDHLLMSFINMEQLVEYNKIPSLKGLKAAKTALTKIEACSNFWVALYIYLSKQKGGDKWRSPWDRAIRNICLSKINLDDSTLSQLLSIYFNTALGEKLNNLAFKHISIRFNKELKFFELYELLDLNYSFENYFSWKPQKIWKYEDGLLLPKKSLQYKFRSFLIETLYDKAITKPELSTMITLFRKFGIKSVSKMENIAQRALFLAP